ncbi:unnamed protein product [Rotaria magnacalcarata]|uniref:Uncharacterized protein n=3 Tax=Rotaria magnacalcarata TaxID=392030 RepID=A0A814GCQ4_9BILA|nr:unnamed protein product [Rotaria magnacalcarata]CAF1469397.1 unnamed protein product [Rotaria magnacalcarata]CAF2105384.1 unnamed protein product [Rotaria magnacalcarata]CAF4000837.1 unnamed protein product [Rotaria magnacalcarata]CAF4274800.1 unnamed protein product [Rotaria magnacalcarata]
MLKFLIIVVLYFIIVNGDSNDDVKKLKETLNQGGKVKQQTVKIVTERGNSAKDDASKDNVDKLKGKTSETRKAGQKSTGTATATSGKNLDATKKTDKELKKKTSESTEDSKHKASHAAKSNKKKDEKVVEKPSRQHEKEKHTTSDTSESIKLTVEETQEQEEKTNDGFVGKFFHMLEDVKNSIFEPVGLSSNTASDATDQATPNPEEVSDTVKKAAGKAKKKLKETADL